MMALGWRESVDVVPVSVGRNRFASSTFQALFPEGLIKVSRGHKDLVIKGHYHFTIGRNNVV